MKLMETNHFCIRKALLSNYRTLSNYLKLVTLRNLFLSMSFTVSIQVCVFPLNMCDIIIHAAQ